MATTAEPRRVAKHAALTKDLVRAARSRARVTPQNAYVSQLAKDLLSRECAPRPAFDQVAHLIADLSRRGQLEDAESIGLMYVAIARFEHQQHYPAPQATLTIEAAHAIEEETEGRVESAETAMAYNPGSVSHYLNYLVAAAAHTRARQQLDELIRLQVVAENAST